MRHDSKRLALSLLTAILCLTGLTGCHDDDEPTEKGHDWVMVWHDEFDTPTKDNRPDPKKWTYDLGPNPSNNELQVYTDREVNAGYTYYKGLGCLHITALKEDYQGYAYTSARLKTQGIYSTQYGRFEARMKLPFGPGIWPAFWMLGRDYDKVGWPQCGEIDIMENRGWQPSMVSSSLHMPGRSGGNPLTQDFSLTGKRFDTDFHVYAVEWSKSSIDFYVDNKLYHHETPLTATGGTWVFDHPFFILLNLAVGGDFVGYPTGDTRFPQNLYIDYVRVYKDRNTIRPEDMDSSGNIEDFNSENGDKGTITLKPEDGK